MSRYLATNLAKIEEEIKTSTPNFRGKAEREQQRALENISRQTTHEENVKLESQKSINYVPRTFGCASKSMNNKRGSQCPQCPMAPSIEIRKQVFAKRKCQTDEAIHKKLKSSMVTSALYKHQTLETTKCFGRNKPHNETMMGTLNFGNTISTTKGLTIGPIRGLKKSRPELQRISSTAKDGYQEGSKPSILGLWWGPGPDLG